jgi:uncharacterized protein (TIGR02147 family)
MPDLLAYQNYREYLKEYYAEQKRLKRNFSYRAFSKKAGINASAFLYYVIKGQRNLTKSSITQITKAIGMGREDAEYFENLVFFNQAVTIPEKTSYYNRLLRARKPRQIEKVKRDNFAYYARWYHSVVRELVTLVDFGQDFRLLGQCAVPPISAKQAQESVALLLRLGFIAKDGKDGYRQTDSVIATWSEGVDVITIEKFQQEMLELARRSFAAFPRAERLNASTTLNISRETFEFFKTKTREFRTELLELARLDPKPDGVYQFTFNLFPIGRCHGKPR